MRVGMCLLLSEKFNGLKQATGGQDSYLCGHHLLMMINVIPRFLEHFVTSSGVLLDQEFVTKWTIIRKKQVSFISLIKCIKSL